MTETVLRYATAIAIALVLLVMLLVVAISVYHGISLESPQIVGLLATVATLGALVVSLLRSNQVASLALDVQDKVNGHLARHTGPTDAHLSELVDARLAEWWAQHADPPATDQSKTGGSD